MASCSKLLLGRMLFLWANGQQTIISVELCVVVWLLEKSNKMLHTVAKTSTPFFICCFDSVRDFFYPTAMKVWLLGKPKKMLEVTLQWTNIPSRVGVRG